MYRFKFLILLVSLMGITCVYSQNNVSNHYNLGIFPNNAYIVYDEKFYFSNLTNDLFEYDLKNDSLKTIHTGKPSMGFPVWMPIKDLKVFKNNLYFLSREPLFDYDLYRYNGIHPPQMIPVMSSPGSSTRNVAIFNNLLYFNAADENHVMQLFKFDGVTPPELISNLWPGSNAPSLGLSIEYKGKLYFRDLVRGKGQVLLEYDGINNPKMMYYDGQTLDIVKEPVDFTIYNNNLYFVSDYGLCVFDGTKVKRLFWYLSAKNLLVCNNKLFFIQNTTDYGHELWAYDGQKDSLYLVRDINKGPTSSNPAFLKVYNHSIYFRTIDESGNNFLWEYNDAKDTLINLYEGRIDDILFVYDNSVFFTFSNSTYFEIWQLSFDENAIIQAPVQRKYVSPTSSIESNTIDEMTIYPIPTKDRLYLISDSSLEAWVRIYTITGELVFTQHINSNEIDVSHLKDGIYMLRMDEKDKTFTTKIVKISQ